MILEIKIGNQIAKNVILLKDKTNLLTVMFHFIAESFLNRFFGSCLKKYESSFLIRSYFFHEHEKFVVARLEKL